MGDADLYIDYDLSNYNPCPTAYRYVDKGGGAYRATLIEDEELWEKYKIRIISFEIADPIENSFPE